MIQVDEILNDFDLCSQFSVIRTTGKFAAGGWQTNPSQQIDTIGATRNANGKEIRMLPEADQVLEVLSFRSITQMFPTTLAGSQTSDVLVFQGDQYRILMVKNYSEQGYYLALATRLAGD